MDGDLSDFGEKKKFLKRVQHQKRLPPPKKIQIKKIIENLFKEVSENVCKQIRD